MITLTINCFKHCKIDQDILMEEEENNTLPELNDLASSLNISEPVFVEEIETEENDREDWENDILNGIEDNIEEEENDIEEEFDQEDTQVPMNIIMNQINSLYNSLLSRSDIPDHMINAMYSVYRDATEIRTNKQVATTIEDYFQVTNNST